MFYEFSTFSPTERLYQGFGTTIPPPLTLAWSLLFSQGQKWSSWTLTLFFWGVGGREGGSICGYQYFQEHYHNTRHTMEVKSVGTFPVILLKLVTPPLPPQTKLNLEQNGWKWVIFSWRYKPKAEQKIVLRSGSYITIAWKGFSHSPKFFCPPL